MTADDRSAALESFFAHHAPRFVRHAAAAGMRPPATAEALTALVSSYEAPGRHYHVLGHACAVVDTLEMLLGALENHPAAAMAAWFHDAIYDARADDNEARSAAMAFELMTIGGADPTLVERACTMILATAGHAVDAVGDTEGRAFLDADLAILGESPDTYDAYASAIRREYAHVPAALYRAGRAHVLRGFLGRPRLYLTEAMFHDRESIARANLAREIAALERSAEG